MLYSLFKPLQFHCSVCSLSVHSECHMLWGAVSGWLPNVCTWCKVVTCVLMGKQSKNPVHRQYLEIMGRGVINLFCELRGGKNQVLKSRSHVLLKPSVCAHKILPSSDRILQQASEMEGRDPKQFCCHAYLQSILSMLPKFWRLMANMQWLRQYSSSKLEICKAFGSLLPDFSAEH